MTKNAIPDEYLDLFEKKAFAYLATVMPDGSPQVTPIWFDFDGTYFLVNSAEGRQKDRNMRRDRRVALCITDPEDPYRYLQIRGVVVEITQEGANQLIDQLSLKYTGNPTFQHYHPDEARVTYKIKPTAVSD